MYLTLEKLRTSPVFNTGVVTDATVADVMGAVITSKKYYAKEANRLNPENSALRFYLLNHLFAEVEARNHKKEPLQGLDLSIANDYFNAVLDNGRAMFTYLLLICTREARHIHDTSYYYTLKEEDEAFFNFLATIRGGGSTRAVEVFLGDTTVLPMSLKDYTATLFNVFDKGSFSSSYGGKAWANIAKVLAAFANGSLSIEMLIDQGFHLAHNNGAIFNKGMMYTMYDDCLYTILDLQRAGQIPNLCAHPKNYKGSYIVPESNIKTLAPYLNKYASLLTVPEIDFKKVMELGAKKSYLHHIKDEFKVGTNGKETPKKATKTDDTVQIHAGLKLTKVVMLRADETNKEEADQWL
ncbi:hypothetical protein [Vibrio phage LV6]|nr:hypothetical protein [Vibrio phage LV6]